MIRLGAIIQMLTINKTMTTLRKCYDKSLTPDDFIRIFRAFDSLRRTRV